MASLSILEEPTDIKRFIKAMRTSMGRGEDIDYDSLAVWALNKFPKYLWRKWSPILRAKGYTWQKFLRVLKFHTGDIIMWALAGELDWEELIKRIIISLERYRGG